MPDPSPVSDFELERLMLEFADYEIIQAGQRSVTASPLDGMSEPVTACSLAVLRVELLWRHRVQVPCGRHADEAQT